MCVCARARVCGQVNLKAVNEDYLVEFPDNVRDELINLNRDIWNFQLRTLETIDREEDAQRAVLAEKQHARAHALGERRAETMQRIQEIQMETVQRLKDKERRWMVSVRAYLDNVQRLLEAKKKEEDAKKKREEALIARGKKK